MTDDYEHFAGIYEVVYDESKIKDTTIDGLEDDGWGWPYGISSSNKSTSKNKTKAKITDGFNYPYGF